ncbi:hypothetical protein BDV59DRAFT_196169 [Aspergillus ambiguus]|uniref:uncharacterized protein n=1 Tax=Aspergillus ambiguus TaxID=176160 RepID=UPI003CCD884C
MAEVKKLGGSLVEISAVSTIIGAPIAEALIHGLKAACGIVWAPMSCFGVIHVVKACLAASAPDFLRESMGLRNQFVDDAIGVVLPVNRFKQARSRMDLGDACAIEVLPQRRWVGQWVLDRWARDSNRPPMKKTQDEMARIRAADISARRPHYRSHCLYTLDRNARLALDTVPSGEKGAPIVIHRFILDLGGIPAAWRDWLCLSLSLAKLVEVVVLRAVGSRRIWVWTMVGWAHAFAAAVLLQTTGLGRDDATKRTRHLVAGTPLPSALRAGEQGKIVLGIPANVRRHVLWRTVLAAAGVGVNLAGLLGTFTSLDGEPTAALYVWIAFQIFWLVLRSVVYYFAPGGTAVQQGLMASRTWETASPDDKTQVLLLLDELAAHQASTHPRGYFAYLRDCMSFAELRTRLHGVDGALTPFLPMRALRGPDASLSIVAVTGDPMIRTAAWMQGCSLDNAELYDACIAFVQVPASEKVAGGGGGGDAAAERVIAVPCVRVYSCDCMAGDGFDRGNSHPECGKIQWWYFFPVDAGSLSEVRELVSAPALSETESGDGEPPPPPPVDLPRWVIAHSTKAAGELDVEVVTEPELERRLSFGWWKISISGMADMRKTWDVGRIAAEAVVRLLR